jgi:metal-responsive CopG/Arc/MetJ family transcriptional regulator
MAMTTGPDGKKTVFASLVLTPDLNDEIQAEAAKRGMNRSLLIRHAVRQWLDAQREELTAA